MTHTTHGSLVGLIVLSGLCPWDVCVIGCMCLNLPSKHEHCLADIHVPRLMSAESQHHVYYQCITDFLEDPLHVLPLLKILGTLNIHGHVG